MDEIKAHLEKDKDILWEERISANGKTYFVGVPAVEIDTENLIESNDSKNFDVAVDWEVDYDWKMPSEKIIGDTSITRYKLSPLLFPGSSEWYVLRIKCIGNHDYLFVDADGDVHSIHAEQERGDDNCITFHSLNPTIKHIRGN